MLALGGIWGIIRKLATISQSYQFWKTIAFSSNENTKHGSYLHCGDFRLYRFCTAEYRFPKLIGCSEAIVLTMEVENSAI